MNTSKDKNIVLVGGGHTHVLVLHAFKAEPLQDAHVTVINPGKTAPYSGMLPGFVAGHYTREDLDIGLAKLSSDVGATLVDDRAIGMDQTRRKVLLESGETLDFDIASVDVGITSRMDALPGFAEHGVPAKPLAAFSSHWDAFRRSAGTKNVVILGGGIAGAELAMAMSHALRNNPATVSVKLLDRSKILSSNSKTAQQRIRRELSKNSVEIIEGADVVELTATNVALADGTRLPANFVVGAAGATPHEWIKNTGLKLVNGFLEVDETLQTSVSGIFAVGDCAHMSFDPRPKAGVFAVRQAPVLTSNLRRALSGGQLISYTPQSDYLKLVSLGGKRAFGERNGWAFSGRLMWWLKNKIDRDFMNQF